MRKVRRVVCGCAIVRRSGRQWRSAQRDGAAHLERTVHDGGTAAPRCISSGAERGEKSDKSACGGCGVPGSWGCARLVVVKAGEVMALELLLERLAKLPSRPCTCRGGLVLAAYSMVGLRGGSSVRSPVVSLTK